ncbi:MAG TPA: SRPBCC domain-containing protein, partial [Gemmatimonadales bacterium]|nr:SRPBCC domain-containing protein [Gemmatimonadales bacterium]
ASRPQTTKALRLSRVLEAPRAAVFRAWTRPDELRRWMAPGDLVVSVVEVDLRPGGRYRFHLREPDGTEHRVVGVYAEIEAPRRLVFSWSLESHPVPVDTRVTVEFRDLGDRTEIALLHEFFPTDELCAMHERGWNACLEKLPGAIGGWH